MLFLLAQINDLVSQLQVDQVEFHVKNCPKQLKKREQ